MTSNSSDSIPSPSSGPGGIRTVTRNGAISAAQVAFISIGYLIAYRVISAELGVELVGVWALCLALASLCTFADLGASEGLVRRIAQSLANEASGVPLRSVFLTGIIFCLVSSLFGAFLLYGVLAIVFDALFSDSMSQDLMRRLLIPALLIATMNLLGNACSGVLEGFERYQFRFGVNLTATLIFIVCVVIFVPAQGVDGMLWAYLGQSGFVLIGGFLLCIYLTKSKSVSSRFSSLQILRDLIGVGLPMRGSGLVTFALDPLTRIAVTHFGGATASGYYEVASRFVMQFRTLVVAGFQAGLPRLVKLDAIDKSVADDVAFGLFRMGVLVAVGGYTFLALCSPVIFLFVLQDVPEQAVLFFALLSIGWCVNSISAPFFFSLVSRRRVRVIWASSGTMAAVNLSLFWILGERIGASGPVLALALAVTLGSIITILARFERRKSLALRAVLPEILLVLSSLLVLVLYFFPIAGSGLDTFSIATLLAFLIPYSCVFLFLFIISGVLR